MTSDNDPMKAFEERLKKQQEEREKKIESDLEDIFGKTLRNVAPPTPAEPAWQAPVAPVTPFVNARVDLTGDATLRKVDDLFIDKFELLKYLTGVNLNYPTIYAETLAEFWSPILEDVNLSPQAKAAVLEQSIAEAQQTARQTNGGGVFGVNLPGRGCYVDGWLFAYGTNKPPRAVLADPKIYGAIIGTVAHEKLGHGFITEFTPLGEEKKRVGLAQVEVAERSNVQVADTPQAVLLRDKNRIVHLSSQWTEEGWATWIETFLTQGPQAHKYRLDAVDKAVKEMARRGPDQRKIADAITRALQVLFSANAVTIADLHAALFSIKTIVTQVPWVNEFIGGILGQELQYVVGYLLVDRIAENAGWQTVPYAILIAANVSYDLDRISVSDLERVITSEPQLNVDSRMTALGRIMLRNRGSIAELAQAAKSGLSYALPKTLRV